MGTAGRIFGAMKSAFLTKREVTTNITTEVAKEVLRPVAMYSCAS